MGLSQFPAAMDRLIGAVRATRTALQDVRDATGALSFRDLGRVQAGLRASKIAGIAVVTEGAASPAAAEAHMASLGGPATMAEFQATMADVEAKAATWNVALEAALAGLSNAELITLAFDTRNGVSTRAIEFKQEIPALKAAPLRQSAEIADLLDAFDAAGA